MMPGPNGDFADSPLASELPDRDSLDSDRDRAAELIAAIVDQYPELRDTTFKPHAIRVFSAPFARALQAAVESADTSDRSAFIAALLGHINATKDPYLALRCLPIIFDLPSGGESAQELADQFGVGRATVSALCIELRTRLRVPPGRGMRRDDTREKYASRQRGKRAKPAPSPWPFRGLMVRVKSSLTA